MDMPRMTNPDGGSEKTHMPGATAKDKRRIWFERKVLGHPQSGRISKEWFVACWEPRKRFGQRRHRCSEECEQFMAFHGPTARPVCQRQVSMERVYLRRNWDFSTDLLSVFLIQTQKRCWEVRSGAAWMGEPLEEDETVPCLPISWHSFLSNSVTRAHSPGGFDLTVKPHPQLKIQIIGRWLEHKGIDIMNRWTCWCCLHGLIQG